MVVWWLVAPVFDVLVVFAFGAIETFIGCSWVAMLPAMATFGYAEHGWLVGCTVLAVTSPTIFCGHYEVGVLSPARWGSTVGSSLLTSLLIFSPLGIAVFSLVSSHVVEAAP